MRAVVFAYHNVGDRCLRVLHARGVDIALVITHRDRADENIWFRRVADTATELGLPFIYGEDPLDPALAEAVAAARPDTIFSFYYRAMLPAALLELAPAGAFNMHGSLLPRYRGRVPVNWAVLHGETETGATLHRMTVKPDAGDIVDQTSVPILPDDTAGEVFEKVTVAAEQTLWRALPAMMAGHVPSHPNRLGEGSYYSGRKPEDGRVDWRQPAAAVYNLIRAVAPPYPGAFTEVGGRRFVIARARRPAASRAEPAMALPTGLAPGLHVVSGRIVGVCGDGAPVLVHELLEHDRPVDPEALALAIAGAASTASTITKPKEENR